MATMEFDSLYSIDQIFCVVFSYLIGNNRRNVGNILSIYESSIFRPRGNASKKMRTLCQEGGQQERDAQESQPERPTKLSPEIWPGPVLHPRENSLPDCLPFCLTVCQFTYLPTAQEPKVKVYLLVLQCKPEQHRAVRARWSECLCTGWSWIHFSSYIKIEAKS